MSDVTITEFLLARIAEQETRLNDMRRSGAVPNSLLVNRTINVALIDCEAKRRIVELCRQIDAEPNPPEALVLADDVLRALALPFVDHPDYDPSWRI